MAIEQGICASFPLECVKGTHVLPTDTLKIALFTSDADLTPDTTAYSTTNEASGTGYTAGGISLTFEDSTPKLIGRVTVLSFEDATFSSVTLSARAALIYNSSKSDKAVAVIDFGGTISRSGSDLVVPSPTVTADTAMIRLIP